MFFIYPQDKKLYRISKEQYFQQGVMRALGVDNMGKLIVLDINDRYGTELFPAEEIERTYDIIIGNSRQSDPDDPPRATAKEVEANLLNMGLIQGFIANHQNR